MMEPSPAPPASPMVGRTVLVVDDSAVQREHAVSMATELGAERVLQACNGVEGLALLEGEPAIDLVLSDLEMPRMDGVTFLGELAARGYRPEVIIVSSQEHQVLHAVHLMSETYGLKVPGVIPKPLNREALTSLLARAAQAAPEAADPKGSARELGPEAILQGIQRGEFVCFYQPQVTLRGALLKGVEALVRWRHPECGLLGPGAFLPQAEAEEGVISALTLCVLKAVAEQWHAWSRRGLNLEVSLNLSARSLNVAGFADRLLDAVQSLGLSGRYLVFEVTESASVSNLGHTLGNLARLRMRGFKLSIDDFGTGFATFEQLERIPFTELKIDRSITQWMPQSERHTIIARRVLQMARDLHLSSVAEGVETLEAWQALKAIECDRAQGYLIARPMPGEDLPGWSAQDRSHLRRGD